MDKDNSNDWILHLQIPKDTEYWDKMVPKLAAFYFMHYLPELNTRKLTLA